MRRRYGGWGLGSQKGEGLELVGLWAAVALEGGG